MIVCSSSAIYPLMVSGLESKMAFSLSERKLKPKTSSHSLKHLNSFFHEKRLSKHELIFLHEKLCDVISVLVDIVASGKALYNQIDIPLRFTHAENLAFLRIKHLIGILSESFIQFTFRAFMQCIGKNIFFCFTSIL